MTAAELGVMFDIELDAVASAAAPGFTNSEKSKLLTKAEDELIKMYVQIGDYKSIYSIVEQKWISSLTSDTSYSTDSLVYYTPIAANIPDFRYFIAARLKITRTYPTVTAKYINCEIIDRKDMGKFIKDGINIPHFKFPKIVLEQNESTDLSRLYILLDSYTAITSPASLEVSYVRKPAGIDITSTTSELPEFLHKDVVSFAVREAVKSLYISKVPQGGEG